jgi:hypothetical protein
VIRRETWQACYHFDVAALRRILMFGGVLLATLACALLGFLLALDGGSHLNFAEFATGVVTMIFGSLVVAGVAAGLLNSSVPSERAIQRGRPRLLPGILFLALVCALDIFAKFAAPKLSARQSQTSLAVDFWVVVGLLVGFFIYAYFLGQKNKALAAQPPNSARGATLRVRRLERDLRNLHWMRNRPWAAFAFLLGALVALIGCVLAPPSVHDAVILHAFGWVFGVAYLFMFGGFLWILFRQGWRPYIDGYISQAQQRLEEAKRFLAEVA